MCRDQVSSGNAGHRRTQCGRASRSVIIQTTLPKLSVHAVLHKPCRERKLTFVGGVVNACSTAACPGKASTRATAETSCRLAGFLCKEAQTKLARSGVDKVVDKLLRILFGLHSPDDCD